MAHPNWQPEDITEYTKERLSSETREETMLIMAGKKTPGRERNGDITG